MGKTVIDLIEEPFNSAEEIRFFLTVDYSKSPSAIAFAFPSKGGGGYEILLEIYKNAECTLVIHRGDNTLDISIVSKQTANSVNIKNLTYRKSNLRIISVQNQLIDSVYFLLGFMNLVGLLSHRQGNRFLH